MAIADDFAEIKRRMVELHGVDAVNGFVELTGPTPEFETDMRAKGFERDPERPHVWVKRDGRTTRVHMDVVTIKDRTCLLSVSGDPITEKDIPHGAFPVSAPTRIVHGTVTPCLVVRETGE